MIMSQLRWRMQSGSRRRRGGVSLLVAALALLLLASSSANGEEPAIDFDRDIRPILAKNCFTCHGPDAAAREAELRLDLRGDAIGPREGGPAITPGSAGESQLFHRITGDDEGPQMPPVDSGLSLTEEQISLLEQWIDQGAEYDTHWAFTPLQPTTPPEVADESWPTSPIDHFILSRLEEHQLTPAGDADRRVWIRRVSFDLTGLPPTPAEVEAFVADDSTAAHEKVVDRLLSSQHFGERWARHWLDLVRYAETYGYEHDWPIPLAWRYRDYVIRALNADVPYDRFVHEHVAGDLLEAPRRHTKEQYNESIIGTGFWYLHGQMSQPVDVKLHEADRFDNQIDVFSRAFLGLTVACARCHDHKFDPVSTEEYYGLLGYLRSSRRQEAYLDSGGKIAAAEQQLAKLRNEAATILADAKAIEDKSSGEDDNQFADTVLFEDFGDGNYHDWFVFGPAFGDAPTQAGQWDRTAENEARAVPPNQAHSGMLAGRLQGTLQSREFTVEHPRVWLRVAGRGRIRIIINGYMMQRYKDQLFRQTEIQVDVPHDKPRWVELAGDLNLYQGHPAYLEIVDNSDDFLLVDEIRFANRPAPNDVGHPTAPKSFYVSRQQQQRLSEIARQMAAVDANIPRPKRALAIRDGNAIDARVNIRGDVRQLGVTAARRAPIVLLASADAPKPMAAEIGSGRLQLADTLTADTNPLLARVRVNWIWHHLFGRGLAPSVDNLGTVGQRPSHPALLDHLATRFRAPSDDNTSGAPGFDWSLKKLIRELVLSRTYRMRSRAHPANAKDVDPTNEWISRMRVRRLEGEAIRDAMLTASGQLNPAPFGPAVPVHLTPFMQGLSRPEKSGPLDGGRRRSIYQEVRRNFLSPMFATFDTPVPTTCVARRSVSNVPAQALTLMNDPFVAQQAAALATRVLAESEATDARIDLLYRYALSRPPSKIEATRARTFLQEQTAAYARSATKEGDGQLPWIDLAHALFGVKEFIFVR